MGGAWRPVVADVAAQYAARDDRDIDTHPDERLPRAALRRHVEARDRTCVHMGCRATAGSTDHDHPLDHAAGGTTGAADLGLVCPHDHRLKHEAGWTLEQPEPVPAEPDPWHDEPAHDTDDPLTLRLAGRAPPTEPAPATPAVPSDELDGPDEPPF